MIPAFNAADEAPGPLWETLGWNDTTEPLNSLVRTLPPLEVSPADKEKFKAFGREFLGPLTTARDALGLAAKWAEPSFYNETQTFPDKIKYFGFTESHHKKLLAALETGKLLAEWKCAVNDDAVAKENDAKVKTVKVCFQALQGAVHSARSKEKDRALDIGGLFVGDELAAMSLADSTDRKTFATLNTTKADVMEDSLVMVGPISPDTSVKNLSMKGFAARSRSPSTASTEGSLDLDKEFAKLRI